MAVLTISVHLGTGSLPVFFRYFANSLTQMWESTSFNVTPKIGNIKVSSKQNFKRKD